MSSQDRGICPFSIVKDLVINEPSMNFIKFFQNEISLVFGVPCDTLFFEGTYHVLVLSTFPLHSL
jgi:hypothetical protein